MLRRFSLTILLLLGAHSIGQQSALPSSSASSVQTSPQSSGQTPQQFAPQQAALPHALHYITVSFDFDFSKTPPCAPVKPNHPCVAQFAVYETTAGTGKKHRIFLFSVPLPAKQTGVVPITFQSPQQIDFVLGWHKLGVGALDNIGNESYMNFCDSCATWINVQQGPSPTPSTSAPGSSTAPPATTARGSPASTP